MDRPLAAPEAMVASGRAVAVGAGAEAGRMQMVEMVGLVEAEDQRIPEEQGVTVVLAVAEVVAVRQAAPAAPASS